MRIVFLFSNGAQLPFRGLKIHLLANPKNRLWDWMAWKRLARIIQEFEPDIVQANSGDTLKYAGFSRFFFRWKSKLLFRNANLISGFINSKPKFLLNKFLLSQCDGVASVSQICLQDFQNLFAWKKPIAHLPIGIDVQLEVRQLPLDILSWLSDSPYLIHIGSFVPEKNHLGLIRIFEKVNQRFPNMKLVLCGNGPLQYEIGKNLPPNILIAGARADVLAILSQAKALLLPSLIEGLPGVILEAMALNIPVVAYDAGGVSELVITGHTGFLVEIGNEEKFVEMIMTLISNPEIQSKVSKEALEFVTQIYRLDKVSADFAGFYQKLLIE